jgi:tetratricopeptide (TPR) repeat protein
LRNLTEAEKLQLCLERDRLLCSSEFARSPTMSKLLRFLVDHKLREDGKPLTAYAVAVDALGRDDSFDTQIDSYPRVQIGRLRRMLDHFYLRENCANRLYIPYHNYEIILGANEASGSESEGAEPEGQPAKKPVPKSRRTQDMFGRRVERHAFVPESPAERQGPVSRRYIWTIFAVFLLLATAGIFYFQKSDSKAGVAIGYPAIIVKATDGPTNPASRARLEAIHSHLVGALGKFDQIRVFNETAEPSVGSRYLLESSNLNDSARPVQLRLVDSVTREVIWSSRIGNSSDQERAAELNQAVIAMAGPYGKIAQHERSKYRVDFTPGYPCLLQFHQYMRYRDEAVLPRVLQCMNESAKQFPNDSYLMSVLASAKNIAEKQGLADTIEGRRDEFAAKAAKIDSNSASATFAVAQSAFYKGDCRRGVLWGERAVGLNPLNSRIMGYLGMYMLACDMPEGEAYADQALRMDPNAELAIAATVAMRQLRRGDAQAAQKLSLKYLDSMPGAAVGLEISFILSSAMLGEKDEARRVWRQLAERSGYPATAAPADVLQKLISDPDILRKLVADFEAAALY